MGDDLTSQQRDAHDRLWRARTEELNAYLRQVHAAANDPGLRVVVRVFCAACDTGAKELGRVVVSPTLGRLLASVVLHEGNRSSVVTEAKESGLRVGRPPRVGFVLAGPHRMSERFSWRPPADDEWPPRVRCPRHGARPVDVEELHRGHSRALRV